MFHGVKSRPSILFGGVLFVFLLCSAAGTLAGQENPTGNLVGFVYASDGNTPLQGAVIKFKNVSTEKFYESAKSDSNGQFVIEGIERGVYMYGVLTSEGDYDSEGLVGLRLNANETAKMSIALKPYSSPAALTMEEFYGDLDVNGESYVGRVIEFDAPKRMAQVQIERGFLQENDKIRAKGRAHDFKQDVDQLESEGAKTKRVFAGEIAALKMKQPVEVDDMVFVLKKRQFLPFLAAPLGAAAVIAASGAVGYGISKQLQEECEPCSPDRNKRKQ
jgi:hypothetical protein